MPSDSRRKSNSIAVIGGGRWARTYIQEIAEGLSADWRICVLSRRNRDGMSAWANTTGLAARMKVVSDWEALLASNVRCAFVVNAVRDHAAAALRIVSAGIPTLVEKPLTAALAQARELVSIAEQKGILLAASHVPLFSRALNSFARVVRSQADARELYFNWSDGRDEVRYGERKTYDASIPVFQDVLPHVVAILSLVAARQIPACESVKIEGGAPA
jgi:predicted dehydrogenase